LGSVVGGAFGWRATFAYAAFVCLICIVLLAWGMPRVRPAAAVGSVVAALFRNYSFMHTLALTTIGFTSAFVIIPFLGPILQKLTGLQGAGIGGLQAFVGLGSFAALAIGGIAADRRLHRVGLALSFLLMGVTALLYAYELDAPRQATAQLAAALLVFLLSVSLFSVIPINLSQLSQLAGPATPVALAANGSLMSMGQGARRDHRRADRRHERLCMVVDCSSRARPFGVDAGPLCSRSRGTAPGRRMRPIILRGD
jgi:predicted MFS family arabinose efflux permease